MSTAEGKEPLLLKVVYMVLFYFVFIILGYILIALGVVQLIVKLLSGNPQADLQRFGGQLGQYAAQLIHYIAMQTEQKPYPFSDWPNNNA